MELDIVHRHNQQTLLHENLGVVGPSGIHCIEADVVDMSWPIAIGMVEIFHWSDTACRKTLIGVPA